MTITKEDIKKVYNMTNDDIVWKPLHANNMIDNPMMGYYAIVNKPSNGDWSARKYTILFQNEETEPGTGRSSNKVNAYILFEKTYFNLNGPLEYPYPNEDGCDCDIHDYGSFVYAYSNIGHARKRALTQYQHIYGYVASHFVEEDDEEWDLK